MRRSFKFGKVLTSQRGFSLVELSIAILIALFLLGGLVTMVMGTRRTNGTQTALSQLQDNQRIAMTMITNVVQKAGYFPNPVTQTLANFPAETLAGVTLSSGQVLGGTYVAAAPGDTFVARFFTPINDATNGNAVINCAGQSNATGSNNVWYTNAFAVGVVNGTSWLQCQVQTSGTGTILTVNLIPNVTKLAVLYAVSAGAAGDDYSVVQYLNATQVGATGNWPNVTAVKITLTFQVPAYGSTGGEMLPSSAPGSTTTMQCVIPVMSRVGVDT
jgi:type IV pilus assembly protein PilW